MYVLDVIVIAKGIQKETLTYFSLKEALPGTLVRVPVRSKIYPALVVSMKDAVDVKSEIKNSPFGFKRIESIVGNAPFRKESVQVAQILADYYLTETGAILDLFVPEAILDEKMPEAKKHEQRKFTSVRNEKLIFQASFDDRISYYKTFIREAFARKESIALIVPTINDATLFYEHLSKGIEENVVLLTSNLTSKKTQTTWRKVLDESHVKLIISTPLFLSLPRTDVSILIIERESSSAYTSRTRPHVDQRLYAEVLATKLDMKIIFADTLLRVETIARREQGEFDEVMPTSFRLPPVRDLQIISMIDNANKTPLSPYFSPQLIDHITRSLSSKQNVFLFALRHGIATKITCADCGLVVLCDKCNVPFTLFEKDKKRILICKNCKLEKIAPTHCQSCESWRLLPLGVGVEALAESARILFPEVQIFRIDSTQNKSPKSATLIAKSFEESGGAILVATEMAFGYLTSPVSSCAVISFDTLLSLPHFDREERLAQLLGTLSLVADRSLIVQTRHPDSHLLVSMQGGSMLDWYRKEIQSRKDANYPPFARLIRLSYVGPREKEEDLRRYAESLLIGYHPHSYRGPHHGIFRETPYLLLQLAPTLWSTNKDVAHRDNVLLPILLRLKGVWDIEIDPKNLYN